MKTLDALGFVGRGRSRHRPRDAAHLYGGPYPFIQTGDVKNANFYITEYRQTYSEAGLTQSKLWPRGTLCITIAANIAETAILNIEACFPDSVIGFIPDKDKADVRYIKYLFNDLQKQYKQYSQGAAQDNLSQQKLLSLSFPVPPLGVQTRIADVLSAYDKLLENNRRRIRLLERAARLLYKEWFVRLSFPGHEHVRVANGVPKGWEKKRLGDITTLITRGITPKYDDKGESLVINQRCIRNCDIDFSPARRQSKAFSKDKQVKYGDVLINSTGAGTLGRVAQLRQNPPNCTVDSHVTIVRPNEDIAALWFGNTLLNHESLFAEMGEGSTNQTELSRHRIGEVKILVAPKRLQCDFEKYMQPTIFQLNNLNQQNQKLQQARDLLLPRLMRGEVRL